MKLLPFVLFFQAALALDQEIITRDVKIKKTTFKCTFKLVSSNSKVTVKKSTVKCTPAKPKKQKVSNLEIEGQFGVYRISFNINPSKITKASLSLSLSPPQPTTTTQGPAVSPPNSCGLGYSRICTPGSDGSCPPHMTVECFGSEPTSQGSECGCLPTILLKDALEDGRNPLDSCTHPCVCVSTTLTSACPSKSILITGGSTAGWNNIGTSELYGGPASCTLPQLPTVRRAHVTFTTADGLVATCGGVNDNAQKCLVLNGTQSWDEDPSKMGNLIKQRWYPNVVTLPVGVYILGGGAGGGTSEFLPTGETVWQAGPKPLPIYPGFEHSCSVPASQTSFLLIGGEVNSVLEYDSNNPEGPTSNTGWKPEGTWPDLIWPTYMHACSRYENKIIVTGGRTDVTVILSMKSTAIIDLTAMTISAGPEMLRAREHHGMATLGTGENLRVLAFGGYPWNDDVEELDLDTNTWISVTENLSGKKNAFGYVAITEQTENMICDG